MKMRVFLSVMFILVSIALYMYFKKLIDDQNTMKANQAEFKVTCAKIQQTLDDREVLFDVLHKDLEMLKEKL